MTLIVAGYEYAKSVDYSKYLEDEAKTYDPEMELEGLFVVADSAITDPNGKTLLNGFRKTYEIDVKLWKPNFTPDGSFHNYIEVFETNKIFISFAGSTLTAQHIINSITTHLGKLRISYRRPEDKSIAYAVVRHCQSNPLENNSSGSAWDDDTFLNRHFEGLLTGDLIASTVEYSITEALTSASKYKLELKDFEAMHTELIAGVWCPVNRRHQLYVYRMESKRDNDGVLVPYTRKRLIPENEVAVLGMTKEFERQAQEAFEISMSSLTSPAQGMLEFLREAIKSIESQGKKGIAFPMSLTTLRRHYLKKSFHQE